MGMMPRIPKLKAITNKGITSRHVHPINKNSKHKEVKKQLQSVPPVKSSSKDTCTSTSNGLTIPKVAPQNYPSRSPPPLINISDDKKTTSKQDVLDKRVSKTNHKRKPSNEDTSIDSSSKAPNPVPNTGTEQLDVEPCNSDIADSARDTTPFTLVLDPSDCSDIETDASVSSLFCQKRLVCVICMIGVILILW